MINAIVLSGGGIGPKRKASIEAKLKNLGYKIKQDIADLSSKDLIVSALSFVKIKEKFKLENLENEIIAPADLFRSKKTNRVSPLSHDKVLKPLSKRLKTEEEEDWIRDFKKGGKKDEACKRVALLEHKNKHLTVVFEALLKYQTCDVEDKFSFGRAVAYERALSVLRSWPVTITKSNYMSLEKAHLFGPKCLEKVVEILETGTCKKLSSYQENSKIKEIERLSHIHGIGANKAAKYVHDGINTVAKLHKALSEAKVKVSDATKFVLDKEIRDEVGDWTSDDVEAFKNVLMSVKKLRSRNIVVEITGGFSRGKNFAHDLDLLVSFETKHHFQKSTLMDYNSFTEILKKENKRLEDIERVVLESFAENFTHKVLTSGIHPEKTLSPKGLTTTLVLVLFKEKWRRLDFVFVCPISMPFAKLGWTGSKYFERSLRLYASRFENSYNARNTWVYKLSSTTLHLDDEVTNKKMKALVVKSEKDIFAFLGINYLAPKERCH